MVSWVGLDLNQFCVCDYVGFIVYLLYVYCLEKVAASTGPTRRGMGAPGMGRGGDGYNAGAALQ